MARKQEYVYIPGKIFWCRSDVPETYGEEAYWSVTVYPNSEGMREVRKLKEPPAIMNIIKKDDDGEYVKFRRPVRKKMGGQWVPFSPPLILDSNGEPLKDVLVGNNSDGIVKLEIYRFTKPREGRAARWESLRVDNLVPYVAKTDLNEEELKQASGLSRQPQLPSF